MNLTIFAMPKAFRGHINVIQRNALQSWKRLGLQPEVILLGADEGTPEAAREFGFRHIPDVARNDFGTPMVNDIFALAEKHATTDWLCYINADILLLDDFSRAADTVSKVTGPVMMIGRRTDVDITEPIDFSHANCGEELRERARQTGILRPPNAIDYFVFTRGLGSGLLPLALGRCWWDNWLLWHARSNGAAVIDVTPVVQIIHQNHDYSHHPGGAKGALSGEEAQRNRKLVGEWFRLHTTEDSTHLLTRNGLQRRYLHWWLMVKRAWSHPRGMVQFLFKLATKPLRNAKTESAATH